MFQACTLCISFGMFNLRHPPLPLPPPPPPPPLSPPPPPPPLSPPPLPPPPPSPPSPPSPLPPPPPPLSPPPPPPPSPLPADLERELRGTFSTPEGRTCRVWHCYMSHTYELLNNSSQTLQDAGLYNMQVGVCVCVCVCVCG